MTSETINGLAAAWQEGLRRALESIAGADTLARFQAKVPAPDGWLDWPEPLWCQLDLGSLAGAVQVGAPRTTVQTLGRLIGRDRELGDAECEEKFLELINQAGMGQERQFSAAQVTAPPPSQDQTIEIDFLWQEASYALALLPSPQLLDLLGSSSLASLMSVLPPAAAAVPGANLDLLLEVELPVIVTFGRTQLPLRDVLKLSSGSIVELNRLANEPVELLINNCVIARGEVVVVDGNYGIRVTEIVSRQERIRSIF
jgi:flagellar motor switch protein FliN